ncbi:hypothetical protein AWB71_03286 [Caballeronia peredens]|nr:hypothetical protein AWB71_03286 [Caballeronia peredens]
MPQKSVAVVDLTAYRTRQNAAAKAAERRPEEKTHEDPLQEVAYHLLMAIRAVKSLKHH